MIIRRRAIACLLPAFAAVVLTGAENADSPTPDQAPDTERNPLTEVEPDERDEAQEEAAATGQGPADEPPVRTAAADGPQAENDEETAPVPANTESAEVFVPSEEISEDFAVPFPVDI